MAYGITLFLEESFVWVLRCARSWGLESRTYQILFFYEMFQLLLIFTTHYCAILTSTPLRFFGAEA